MFGISAVGIVAGLVGLFFLAGAIGNWIAPPRIAADYRRWGYPAYFHYVTAVLELAAGILLLLAPTRLYGAALGMLVMAAALVTLVRHKEYGHSIPPLLVLLACMAISVSGLSTLHG